MKLRSKAKGKPGSSPATPDAVKDAFNFDGISEKIKEIEEGDSDQDTCLVKVTDAIRQILATLQAVAKSVEKQSDTYDQLLQTSQQQTAATEKLVKELTECREENKKFKEENVKLQQQVNDLEQYSRNYNIEIQGVPVHPGENVYNIVVETSRFLGADVRSGDIEFCHRLRKSDRHPNKPPAIIAKFYSRQIKQEILGGKKEKRVITAKDIGFTNSSNKVFVNEHLTAINKNLFWLARGVTDYKFKWTRSGKVYMRKDEQSPVIRVAKPSDIPV